MGWFGICNKEKYMEVAYRSEMPLEEYGICSKKMPQLATGLR